MISARGVARAAVLAAVAVMVAGVGQEVGAVSTFATGVSGNNVVGYYFGTDGSGPYCYLYDTSSSTYTILNVPGASFAGATGVYGNTVVGNCGDSPEVRSGFLYDASSSNYTILDAPGAVIRGTAATGVSGNNIVGDYYSGGWHGFLYDGSTYTALNAPEPPPGPGPSAVPEPASVVCGLIGFGMIGRYLKKRRSA